MTVLSSNESEQTKSADTIIGPGARLRKERESQGLDQVRIAAQLHLSETMVEALEWDDFEALPGVVFTQGYLRNYARLLGLPESEILASYQQLCPEDSQECLNAKHSVKIEHEVHSSHGLVQLATWLIVIGLIALLFFWWQGRFGWQDEAVEDAVSEVEIMDQPFAMDDTLPEAPAVSSFAQTIETEDSSVQAESMPEGGIEDQPERFIESQAEKLQAVSEELAESEPETSAAGEQSVRLEEDMPPAQEAALEIGQDLQPEPEGSGQLVFEFTGRCWAEVRDASGKAHIIGEKRAGYRRVIEADQGPFKVILGDASVVHLTLNGKSYDLSPHTRGNVARFTLETE
ncbi:MAG: RodZ domain-containing protein [Pseudomonadota bacterium]